MPCPECSENHARALRSEAAEKSLLLFMNTFSRLSRQLADIEQEADRRRLEANPPPPGAAPVKRPRFVMVPAETFFGLLTSDEDGRATTE